VPEQRAGRGEAAGRAPAGGVQRRVGHGPGPGGAVLQIPLPPGAGRVRRRWSQLVSLARLTVGHLVDVRGPSLLSVYISTTAAGDQLPLQLSVASPAIDHPS
jgi:hypothetical protein